MTYFNMLIPAVIVHRQVVGATLLTLHF